MRHIPVALLISRIGEYLLAQQIDVLEIFRYMGFFFLAVITITSLFLHNPTPAKKGSLERSDIKTLLKSRNFWGLFCAIYSASCIGLMVIGKIKPLGLSLNLNAIARLIWGIISSMMEGKRVILYSLISSVLVCLSAPFIVRDALSFKIFSVIAGLNYASCNVCMLLR